MDILEKIKESDQYHIRNVDRIVYNIREKYKDTMITDWAHINHELYTIDRCDGLISVLLRIYYWSDLIEGSKEHWTKMVYLFYHDIPKQKGRNKHFPLQKKIYTAMREPFPDIEYIGTSLHYGYCQKSESGYDKLPNIIIDKEGMEFCDKYIWWLSDRLSLNGKVNLDEIEEKINELMKER